MANNYDHQKIEQKWQKKWQELCLYRTREEKGKPKFYCLDMFPYPSGAGLHVGHPKGYIATDVAARLKMMQGYNVLHPMGWDAFGLPAENFALKNKTHPRKTTKENIARFKSQLEKIGFTYDWEREINTTDPEFYRWTQWIFLEMFKRGLAYESYAPINWCPSCKTGLANEDLENGRCERCGSEIERRPMRQWVLKITKYADRLLEDLDKLPEWEESIKEMQRNWIGRSYGAKIKFSLQKTRIDADGTQINADNETRIDADETQINADNEIQINADENLLYKDLTYKIRGAIFNVSNNVGLGHKESVYHKALEIEFKKIGLKFDSEKRIAINYEGKKIGTYQPDFIIDNKILIELKALPKIFKQQLNQVWTYLKGSDYKLALLVNFSPAGLEIKRIVYDTARNLPKTLNQRESAFHPRESVLLNQRQSAFYPRESASLEVFTTRPDTLFGCSYVVVAPEHPLIEQLKDKIENYQEVKEYIEQAKKKSDLERTDLAKEKTGVKIKGLTAINPVIAWRQYQSAPSDPRQSALLNQRQSAFYPRESAISAEIPVFVADYVLVNYGTGAIMAVPAHDERDFEFALQMNAKEKNEEEKLKIRKVVQPFSSAPKTALLLHGLGGHGEENWFPWLKKELEKNGWNVLAPNLPHSACPQAEEWLEFLAKEIKPKLKGEVTIIGHSLGALAACLFLSKENIEVKNLILVAPATPNGKNKEELIKAGLPAASLKNISEFFSLKLNKKKLKHLVEKTFLFLSQNDPYILEDKAKEFFSFLSPKILVFPQMGHFSDRHKIFQLPEVLWAAEGVFSGQGIAINSDFLNGLPTEEAKKKMIAWLEEQGVGEKAVNYKLQDWVFSRQRYWGEPIPLVYCEHCKKEVEKFLREEEIDLTNLRAADKEKIKKAGFTLGELLNPGWVADENLPVTLPEVESYEPTGTGESPLANIKEWVETKCPKCGHSARRETNTMPQWAGSSWYYLRYIDPYNNEALVDKEKEKYWSPVDLYVGGAEHATRHLIYARFWHKFLYDIGAINYEEPFKKLRHVGLILAEDHRKMSKRWGNVINPDDIVKEYGADTLRVYEMFMGPFSQPVAWSAKSLKGARRFLERVFSLKEKIKKEPEEKDFLCLLHQTILKVTQDIEDFKFNTAISQLMILVNKAFEQGGLTEKSYKILLRLLAPFAPHLTEELWEAIGEQESIFLAKWPDYDKKLAQEKKIVFVLQVNGKVRDKLEATEDLSEEEIKKIALSREKIKKWIQGKEIKKIIFVPKKLINIVVK